jgi:hypothetical protein
MIGHRAGRHQIEFVGQRPPDVAEGAQPRDGVPQIAVVVGRAHLGKTPAVVGMPKDQVRLDPQLLQVVESAVPMPPECRVGPGEVELAVGLLDEREPFRLVPVVGVALRKDAEADLVERRSGQRLERLRCIASG